MCELERFKHGEDWFVGHGYDVYRCTIIAASSCQVVVRVHGMLSILYFGFGDSVFSVNAFIAPVPPKPPSAWPRRLTNLLLIAIALNALAWWLLMVFDRAAALGLLQPL